MSRIFRSIGATLTLLIAACGPDAPPATTPPASVPSVAAPNAAAVTAVVVHHAGLVHASYLESLERARELVVACRALSETPSPDTLTAARSAWVAARRAYAPTEAFRFYGGPIDAADGGPEGLINAWPIDERYIESGDAAHPGIIEDAAHHPVIAEDALVALNEKDGETNISTGFHAIELLLWGVDRRTDGPGDRPATDFAAANPHGPRRGEYLNATARLIVRHLDGLVVAWAPGNPGNYRARFEAGGTASLRDLLKGLAMLGADELAGERMAVALEQRDSEHEQSCFSDTTLADHEGNARGIAGAYAGKLAGRTGPSPSSLIAAIDPGLDGEITRAMEASVRAIAAIPAPFDQAILADPGRAAIATAIAALEQQTALLVRGAARLGLDLGIAAGSGSGSAGGSGNSDGAAAGSGSAASR